VAAVVVSGVQAAPSGDVGHELRQDVFPLL